MSRALALGAVAALVVCVGLAAAVLVPRATETAAPRIGGPFTLEDGSGKTVTDRDFRGRFMLIYFGYTHCPDACPTTLSDIAAALDKLPAKDKARVVPLFVTVDPARDTPTVIGDYAKAFGPEFVGLSGNATEIGAAEREFHVYAEKHPLAHGDYGMDHSSIMYLMGPDGRFVDVISDGTKPAEIAERLQAAGV